MSPRSLLAALVGGLLTAGCSVFGGTAAPEPDYTVVLADPPFEIRDYPTLTVAETVAEGPRDRAVGTGFRRLFDYISGANAGSQDIAMTAPVLTEPEGREIAMTAPVLTEPAGEGGAAGGHKVAFVLPAGFDAATAPRPTDPAVTIATVPARRVAVVRFSGILDAALVAEQRAALEAWLATRPETPAGAWQAAGYNPPWTLPWLRRNEVMVEIAAGE